jgi:hypothetical protein
MNSGPTSGIAWISSEDAETARHRFTPAEQAAMLDQENRDFPLPSHSATVWKYYRPQHFQDLLDSATLYFCQVSRFTDEAEARMNRFQSDSMERYLRDNPDTLSALKSFHERVRSRSWVTCPSVAHHEAAHMWPRFCGPTEGVAIKTNLRSLQMALPQGGPLAGRVYPSLVRYAETDYMPWKIGYLLFQKLPCYDDEQELRLCISRPEEQIASANCSTESVPVPIHMRHLIHEIRVHPQAPNSYFRKILSLIGKYLPDRQNRVRWSVLRK